MAGIGVRLNRIFSKNTIASNLVGCGYSMVVTIAPMVLVIVNVFLMQYFLGFSKSGYASRELFACTLLYMFIFSLITSAPFNTVLSKYMSDVIYNETYEDIMPCYNVGLLMNIVFSVIVGGIFCIREYVVGKVAFYYVFTGFCGYVCMVLVFYSMLYLLICKDYKKVSLYFLIGMVLAFGLAFLFVKGLGISVGYGMLLALTIGFLVIACLEMALFTSYFRENSGKYKEVLLYFKKFWPLMVSNFFYVLGLYIHNFVFWSTDMHMVVAKSFVCMQSYDLASCIAMFTNISSTVIFISRVEMYFHSRYKAFSEAIIGGRAMDIDIAKRRMFRQLNNELMSLVRVQFIVTMVIFLFCITILPSFGMGGMPIKIYPCLAVGYFILFVMYAEIIFLYYYSDLDGAVLVSVIFCFVTLAGSIVATTFPVAWYGAGLVVGAFTGWTVAYFRLRYIEKHLNVHIFCVGSIMKPGKGKKPSSLVFDRTELEKLKKKKKQHVKLRNN